MLTELRVQDLGVIAELSLVLGEGMTVLTGETGAGKTLVVEAIELLVGGRADPVLVRPGAGEARVEGRFVVGDEELVLARVVPKDGRSRAYVNGRLATAANLAEEGRRLVDLHGQHAHQSLLATAAQRDALDRFGEVDLRPLQVARQHVAELDAAISALGGDERARAREIDLLRFQLNELAAAQLHDPDEDATLAAQEELLAGALAHRDAGERAHVTLSNDGGGLDSVRSAIAALAPRAPFAEVAGRLRAITADLDDVVGELRGLLDGLEEDPERLAAVRARRNLLHQLQRKYGDSLAEVITFADEVGRRLDELERHDQRAAQLEAERASAAARVAAAERLVGASRRAAAPHLGAAIAANLHELAMQKAIVEIDVGADPGDEVVFRLAANPGEPALPLAKVASGGELARAMLGVRLVLTESPPSLVFDEVDAGIGGSAALAVGRALATIARTHQVLVVTHLAQVAAFADHHVVVAKQERDGRTVSSAAAVAGAERLEELSRMLSGLSASSTARRHAKELLAEARRGGR